MSIRSVNQILKPQQVSDGAGVKLNRVFGYNETELTDPFLLLDHLKNDDPSIGMAGFPWHPHRGIETITYMLKGGIEHEDSMGNKGSLLAGDVQWMTAGSGIIHQEMPLSGAGNLYHGFQLWSNLPSSHKMMNPRYQDIPSNEIPGVTEDDGSHARIITGEFWGKTGPVSGIITKPQYIDLFIPALSEKIIKIDIEQNAFAYIFEGSGSFPNTSNPKASAIEYQNLVLFDKGDEIRVKAGEDGLRFLLISGAPIKEPIAWSGPIVMNTRKELSDSFNEYYNGTFLNHHFDK